ncbi:hypothetical protein ACFOED_11400 [Vulcaniibacterium thermophilum]|uniref:Uncharacterized protein n=1 Tax=Vulcaniibacterium thermophilum TaxID=1169913 RepID=A0A918ZAZ6_9GAMM|nr:hypothetical protein [Vulcaniibacterium thermophilum]GHE42758.1 hypothetical protein GCM10007167_25820 [Vulcaniibacterium thermophilum]
MTDALRMLETLATSPYGVDEAGLEAMLGALEPECQEAFRAADIRALTAALRGRPHVMCAIAAPDQDEPEPAREPGDQPVPEPGRTPDDGAD